MRKLLLHFGMHRSKSTSIQYALKEIANHDNNNTFYLPKFTNVAESIDINNHNLLIINDKNDVGSLLSGSLNG